MRYSTLSYDGLYHVLPQGCECLLYKAFMSFSISMYFVNNEASGMWIKGSFPYVYYGLSDCGITLLIKEEGIICMSLRTLTLKPMIISFGEKNTSN